MIKLIERVKNLINSFINMEDKKKKKEMTIFFVYFTLVIIAVLSEYQFSTKTIRIFRPLGNDFNELLHLAITGNTIYIVYLLDFIKYNIIFLFIDLFNLFFDSSVNINIEKTLLELNLFFQTNGYENVSKFLIIKGIEDALSLELFYFNYFNYGFFKTIFFKTNLPIFFYFGMLFILTTISSLFLLSYYGFYGVFFLNLISILFF
jgi:hypothetical protein